jgi:hypothetical protein
MKSSIRYEIRRSMIVTCVVIEELNGEYKEPARGLNASFLPFVRRNKSCVKYDGAPWIRSSTLFLAKLTTKIALTCSARETSLTFLVSTLLSAYL